jgi:hypothetical protein
MSLLQFSGLCLVIVLLTHYGVLPWLRRRVRREPTPASLTKIAWLAVLRYARGAAVAGAVTSLTVAGMVEVLRWRALPLAKVSVIREALRGELDLKRRLDEAHPYWFGAAAVLLTSALGVHTFRRRRGQWAAAFSAMQDAEIQRLLRAMNEDPHWWDLTPDADMNRIIARIQEIQHAIPRMQEADRPAAEQAIEQYRLYLVQLDVLRRMNLKFDPDAVEEPEPETWCDWVSGLLGSRRVVGSTRAGTRLLYRFNAVLLVTGLIGFQSAAVNGVIQDRIVALNDLVVRLDNLEAIKQEVALAEADAAEEARPEAQASSPTSTSVSHVPTWSAKVTSKVASLSDQIEKARSARPNYQSEDEVIEKLAVQADEHAVRARDLADLDTEIRRAAAEVEKTGPPQAGRPGGNTPGGPRDTGEQLTKLRDRLNRLEVKTDPDRFLTPKADALRERLARGDRGAAVQALDGEAGALESEVVGLKSSVRTRPGTLSGRLREVGPIESHSDEIADLSRRIEALKADSGGRFDRVMRRLNSVRGEIASEASRRAQELSLRRVRAEAVRNRIVAVDQAEAVLPAKADEARAFLSSAEARNGWENARHARDVSPGTLTADDDAAAKVMARAYEEALGESAPVRGTIPEPDALASARLRGLATRNEILERARRVAPSERVRPPSPSEVPALNGAQRKVASAAESIFRSEVQRTAAGQGMYEQVVQEMRLSPRFRELVRLQAPAARARLLGGAAVTPRAPPGGRLWGELSLTAFDAAVERVAGVDVADAVGEIARSTLRHHELARRYAFMSDLAGGESGLNTALERLAADDTRAPLPGTGRDYLRRVNAANPVAETARAVAPYEPAIEVPFEPGVNLEKAGAIVL